MRKLGISMLMATLLIGYGSAVLARGGGGMGGAAPGHMGARGQENTNAQWQPDATRGKERAEERQIMQESREQERVQEQTRERVKKKDGTGDGATVQTRERTREQLEIRQRTETQAAPR